MKLYIKAVQSTLVVHHCKEVLKFSSPCVKETWFKMLKPVYLGLTVTVPQFKGEMVIHWEPAQASLCWPFLYVSTFCSAFCSFVDVNKSANTQSLCLDNLWPFQPSLTSIHPFYLPF